MKTGECHDKEGMREKIAQACEEKAGRTGVARIHEQRKARQRGGISISVRANFSHPVWVAVYFDRAATWIVHRTWRGGLNWNGTTPGMWVVWATVGVNRSIHAY
ncbi:unnamed protein product [Phaeothamnion confervicola]